MNFIDKVIFIVFFLVIGIGYLWCQTVPPLNDVPTTSNDIPPKIIAIGNQAYCPLSQINIATAFDIEDPSMTDIRNLYIQISEGYVSGQEVLTLSNRNSHPDITPYWNLLEGKLTLTSANSGEQSQLDLIAAAKDVVFESTDINVSGEKLFSFTIGNANYLPSTGHYYEYIEDKGITWTQAKSSAEALNYYGLQGYLATITTSDEAKLSGEQAAGTGWIGGSDAQVEGQWKWMTGPEAGTLFYTGQYPTGNTVPNSYSFWNRQEPNNLGNEDYAHVTAPSIGIRGSWNDLKVTGALDSNSSYHPQGFIVEYGGMPGDPDLDLSAYTRIYIAALESTMNESNCGPGAVTLIAELDTISPNAEVLWFDTDLSDNPIFIGEIFETPNLTTTTTYFVLASEDNCFEGPRTEVIASIYEIPVIEPFVTLKNCDEDGNPDGFVDFNLREADEFINLGDDSLIITYYSTSADAEDELNPINPSPYNNSNGNTVYGRAENTDGCFQVATVNLEVSTTSFPPGYQQELVECDNDDTIDGLAFFDLTLASEDFLDQFPTGQNLTVQYYRNANDAQLEQNEILPQNNYHSEDPFSQTIYVRVESEDNGDCFGIGPHLVLTVNERPEFDVSPDAFVCLNLPPITLVTFNASEELSYIWKDEGGTTISTAPTVDVSEGGIYTVIGTTNLGCASFQKSVFVAESVIATITEDDLTIIDDSENNSIAIDNSGDNLGIGDYEFALDNGFGPYQDESFFEYVSSGIHTVYVRDKNGCGVASIEVPIIGYPKFFTPNSDGYNDTWQVRGISEEFYPSSFIYIFDRFGKTIASVDPYGDGWNGFYNGTLMPSNDYWFSVQLTDKNGAIREKSGHFSLIIE